MAPSVEPVYSENQPDDVVMQYTRANFHDDQDGEGDLFYSVRRIVVEILEERDDEIEVELRVIDNTNSGEYALLGTFRNFPPFEKYKEFAETATFDKAEVPYYRDDFPNTESYVLRGERVVPNVDEWSKSQPFRP